MVPNERAHPCNSRHKQAYLVSHDILESVIHKKGNGRKYKVGWNCPAAHRCSSGGAGDFWKEVEEIQLRIEKKMLPGMKKWCSPYNPLLCIEEAIYMISQCHSQLYPPIWVRAGTKNSRPMVSYGRNSTRIPSSINTTPPINIIAMVFLFPPYGVASMNCPNPMRGWPSEGVGRGRLRWV